MGEIKKQSINNTILSYIGAFIGFLSLVYIQPYFLGSKDIGLLKLIYSFSWLIAMVIPFGMSNVTLRFFPKFKNDTNTHHGYFGLLTLIVGIGALIMLVLFFCFEGTFREYYKASPNFVPYYYYCFLFSFIFSLISVYNVYCSSLFKTTFSVFLTDVYTRIGFIVIIFLFFMNVIQERGLVISYIAVYFFQLLFLVIYIFRLKAFSFRINWSFYKSIDKRSMLVFAIVTTFGSFASLGIKFIDGLILGHYIDDIKLIGVYSVCAFIPSILEIPFNNLDRIAQPKIAHAWHHGNTREIEKIYELSSRYMFFIGGALICCLYAGTDFLFATLPHEYMAGKPVFLILSVSSLLNLLTGVNSTIISLSEKYFVTSLLLALLIALAIVSHIVLIPLYGIRGAAIATCIAIGFFNILKYFYILIRFNMQPFSKYTLYILVMTLVCLAGIYAIPEGLHPLVKAIIGCSVTGAVFILINIKFSMISEINQMLRRFRLIR